MRSGAKAWWYWVLLIVLLFTLHHFVTFTLFSLVPWPLALALVLAYTIDRPWRFLLLLGVVAELLAQSPPGVLLVAILLPLIVKNIIKRPEASVSFPFFFSLLLQAAGQVGILLIGVGISSLPHTLPALTSALPLLPALGMIGGLTVVPSIAILVWFELVAPYRIQRTIPRFKQI